METCFSLSFPSFLFYAPPSSRIINVHLICSTHSSPFTHLLLLFPNKPDYIKLNYFLSLYSYSYFIHFSRKCKLFVCESEWKVLHPSPISFLRTKVLSLILIIFLSFYDPLVLGKEWWNNKKITFNDFLCSFSRNPRQISFSWIHDKGRHTVFEKSFCLLYSFSFSIFSMKVRSNEGS